MLDRNEVTEKMKERGFINYAIIGGNKLHFVSSHLYDFNYKEKTPLRKRKPAITIIVNLENAEFNCIYNITNSINSLTGPKCSSVMNDKHFDKIVCEFETLAKWISKLCG